MFSPKCSENLNLDNLDLFSSKKTPLLVPYPAYYMNVRPNSRRAYPNLHIPILNSFFQIRPNCSTHIDRTQSLKYYGTWVVDLKVHLVLVHD